MKRKIKGFFEDSLIVIILITIIYGSYSYFFDDSMDNFEASQTIIQTNDEPKQDIKEMSQDEAIKDVITDENPDIETENRTPPALIQNNQETKSTTEQKEETVESKTPVLKENNSSLKREINLIENSKLEKSSSNEEQIEKEKFYLDLKNKILSNIDKNFDKSSLNEITSTDIRVTILKDGRIEQLIMTSGNEKLFNSIKNSIYNSFPVEISPSLKGIFPRYYRLKIEFN